MKRGIYRRSDEGEGRSLTAASANLSSRRISEFRIFTNEVRFLPRHSPRVSIPRIDTNFSTTLINFAAFFIISFFFFLFNCANFFPRWSLDWMLLFFFFDQSIDLHFTRVARFTRGREIVWNFYFIIQPLRNEASVDYRRE